MISNLKENNMKQKKKHTNTRRLCDEADEW